MTVCRQVVSRAATSAWPAEPGDSRCRSSNDAHERGCAPPHRRGDGRGVDLIVGRDHAAEGYGRARDRARHPWYPTVQSRATRRRHTARGGSRRAPARAMSSYRDQARPQQASASVAIVHAAPGAVAGGVGTRRHAEPEARTGTVWRAPPQQCECRATCARPHPGAQAPPMRTPSPANRDPST